MARTHVVMSDNVVEAIDKIVGQRGRSRFLEEAARDRLRRLALEKDLQTRKRVIDPRAYPHWRDAETTRAWVRTVRRTERP